VTCSIRSRAIAGHIDRDADTSAPTMNTGRTIPERRSRIEADMGASSAMTVADRIAALDWDAIEGSLHADGDARMPPVLTPEDCLRQDLYGKVAFPLQLPCFLSRPGVDDEGGEFLLVEQRPRAQSRGEAIRTEPGEIIVFPTRERPVEGTRGPCRVTMRHGVSRVRAGARYTLGIIFHDAR
jgi:hypothetical protein